MRGIIFKWEVFLVYIYVCLCVLAYMWHCLSFFLPTVTLISPLYLLLLLYGPLMFWLTMFTIFFFPYTFKLSIIFKKKRNIAKCAVVQVK